MFRNYLAAALRNLVRNRLYTAINVIGLAVGFAAALLIALFVRDEFSYDKWIPGHERTYGVYMRAYTDSSSSEWNTAVSDMAQMLKLDFPEVEEATRLRIYAGASLRHGDNDFTDTAYWADPNIFRVLPLPAIAGDLNTALNEPDSVVMTRRMARKYFGREDAVGETIELARQHPLRVTAVLEDLPSNTALNAEIIMSGISTYSDLTVMDARPVRGPDQALNVKAAYTYVRLKPGAAVEDVRAAVPAFVSRRMQDQSRGVTRRQEPVFVALTDLHLIHFGNNPMKPPGDLDAIHALIVTGGIILGLAVLNFISLMTARAGRRAVEVGIRKVSGANRRHLVVQFVGESLVYVIIGAGTAVALASAFLPSTNAFLLRTIALWPSVDLSILVAFIAFVAALGVLAGFYPAFVLSSFPPAMVLKGGTIHESSAIRWTRQIFVTLQFAILVGLMLCAAVIFRQTHYAQNEALRLDKDQVILVPSLCKNTFRDEVGKLPGVQVQACSALAPLTHHGYSRVTTQTGDDVDIALNPVDFGFFELYGLQPLAGRFFSRDYGGDSVAPGQTETHPNIVINETAAARFGFSSPSAAIGQSISFGRFLANTPGKVTPRLPAEIVGVVPDFPIGPINAAILPTIFFVDPGFFFTLHVKLNGREIPETLEAMKQLWSHYTNYPFTFTFLDQRVQAFYADITREAQVFAAFSAIAIFIACLGLFGLSAFTAERRTKEIGIRKAMGASRADILRLLLWQFAKPVLWANVIAWPVGYYVMNRWLSAFAYHVDLEPWIFLAASGAALLIALLTVAGHALAVSRAKPVGALRYE